MKIKIDPNLSKIEFWAIGEEIPKVTGGSIRKYGPEALIHTFRRPQLIIDNAAIMRLPSTKRDLIIRLLEFPQRTTEYDDVSLAWSDIKYPAVWSPSIDTILFARALRHLFQSSQYYKNLNSFLEIGCGSGFLSKYILKKKLDAGNPVSYAHLMDINRDALVCAMDAIGEVRDETLISYSLNIPKQAIKVANPYDLVLCNPPYVPRPHENPANPFEGLFLYSEILKRCREMMRPESRLVINFSSLSRDDLVPEFHKLFSMKTIYRKKVPLKIPLITAKFSEESKRWMACLEKDKRFFIDPSERSGYRYWHTIEIVECVLKR